MARKVFISFLGTNDYIPCIYSLGSYQSSVVKFVQSALVKMCCSNWTQNDVIIIFTTNEALTNWDKLQEGWELQIFPQKKSIPSGKDVKEIWDIFQIMYDSLLENDELYIDITHSFRSIPLLASSLLQYAKFLKNISVNAIYYGAFETLGNSRDVEKRIPNPNDRIAPIFDLTAFSEIQDWSVAANDFINFGNSNRLNKLTSDNITPILKKKQGENKIALEIKGLNKYVENLCLDIKTGRSLPLIDGENASKIIDKLKTLEQELIPPLNPILSKIKNSIEEIYKGKNEIVNVLYTVKWCIEKQLIQEGITLLQEGIITYFLKDDCKNKHKREFTSGYLSHKHKNDFDPKRFILKADEKEELENYFESFSNIQDWSRLYSQIADIRNDINHAGMIQPTAANQFAKKLNELYLKTQELI
jgi:CRISPR-associated DxTHG motif protein